MASSRKQLFHTRLAVVLPNLPINSSTISMTTRMARIAESRGYHATLTFLRSGKPDINDLLSAGRIADELVSFTPLPDDIVQQLRDADIVVRPPIVETGTPFFNIYAGVSSHIGRIMTERMIFRGRENLAYVCVDDPGFDLMTQLRYAGMIDACLKRGIKSPIMFRTVYSNPNLAGDIVNFMRKHPQIDGFLCHNDLLAIEMLQALRMTGRTVPSDVAVIGVDNVDEAALINPTLTSVAYELTPASEILGKAFVATLDEKPAQVLSPEELNELCFLVTRESA
ncbi:MAG: substrate-binding domain-containing protein [Actinomycetaceae bacterium]|nr:substrate-binding domain-containing protein [Actinomycetaceae bacterium]